MKRYFAVIQKATNTAPQPPIALAPASPTTPGTSAAAMDDLPAESAKKQCITPPTATEEESEPKMELGLKVTKASTEGGGAGIIKLARGSVVDFEGDCIVNAANEHGLGGGGVDGAVNSRGGPAFELERAQSLEIAVPGTLVRIPTGTAKTTRAMGGLKCSFVIHAVGPDYRRYSKEEGDLKLANAYKSALQEGRAKISARADTSTASTTIAFALLSSGIFRGKRGLEQVLQIGVNALREEMREGEIVYLVAFSDIEHDLLSKLLLV